MASMGKVIIVMKDYSEVMALLEELRDLKAAIRARRDAAEETLKGVDAAVIPADDEGRVRVQHEADVWDEVAALLKPEA